MPLTEPVKPRVETSIVLAASTVKVPVTFTPSRLMVVAVVFVCVRTDPVIVRFGANSVPFTSAVALSIVTSLMPSAVVRRKMPDVPPTNVFVVRPVLSAIAAPRLVALSTRNMPR